MLKRLLIAPVLFLSACACSQPAVSALKDGVSVNKGHMNDQSLPEPARLIAQDNHDLMWQVLHYMTDEALPQDVQARMAARAGGK